MALGVPQGLFRPFGERKNILRLPGIEPCIVPPFTYSPVSDCFFNSLFQLFGCKIFS
jgi:hypothetical protein